ncbi:MAG: DUF1304 domain-containing protein [Bdellovibrionales bacterium]|nr:DUF1304 domain-containing protein [Oligoflexia bacterium]
MEMIFILQTGVLFVTALIHVYVFALESFLWQKPSTRKAFKTSEEEARLSAGLAYNLGFYNLFLALGLFYGIWLGQPGLVMTNYIMCFVFGAGMVLFVSRPQMRMSSLYQLAPPVLYFILKSIGNRMI